MTEQTETWVMVIYDSTDPAEVAVMVTSGEHLRDDGKPNRPLTAWTINPRKISP